ncbi:pulmonary surfactant-associated protein D-like [Pseudophryne corroboree]|uniref:pulmonary surfactant-associated protein D-like n=1 Tax=Pseudophryne corroboree TaxID=495146 RepID=UPI0030812A66
MQALQALCTLISASLVLSGTQICKDPDSNAYSVITCGAPGKDGLPGMDGKEGLKGEKGEQGLPGQSGLPGVDGPSGPEGKQGPSGQIGEKGDSGAPGLPGQSGLPGVDGQSGQEGKQGPSGQKGEKGDSGAPALEALKMQMSVLTEQISTLQSQMRKQKKAFMFFKGGATSGEKYYVSNGEKANYHDAMTACGKVGGQLASPTNAEENQAVLSIAWQYRANPVLGISDIQTKGTFRYPSGEIISYSNWSPKKPNNKKENENCVEMDDKGRWNSKNCKEKHLFICEFSSI